MGTTLNDVAKDKALQDLHEEAVLDRALLDQAIYLFVEGESEERALPLLYTNILDMKSVGVQIANYNGHGNLWHALRLLKRTLSYDRPIIITHDNDPDSIASVNKCKKYNVIDELTFVFSIPSEPVVSYSNGHKGGAFEESFPIEVFLDAVFAIEILPESLIAQRYEFESNFNPLKPWLSQLIKFSKDIGIINLSLNKPQLAVAIAKKCKGIPLTFSKLEVMIREVRDEYPVIHPYDVELPEIPGLTC